MPYKIRNAAKRFYSWLDENLYTILKDWMIAITIIGTVLALISAVELAITGSWAIAILWSTWIISTTVMGLFVLFHSQEVATD